eukprot:CAMPEP_0197399932 /NCGR_PEP_ID=MMETSP1165-20131217/16063_1 /TAXON_ID=284809 /ORGANISM="Chrysocystis fragilis, Strain CCMP3189" /LENGTH=558 /DNA_ID=CAMNT_0042925963 /DNA_START=219 /DNA_END=1892 /DNA_ORIENTATION=+
MAGPAGRREKWWEKRRNDAAVGVSAVALVRRGGSGGESAMRVRVGRSGGREGGKREELVVGGREFAEALDEVELDELHGGLVEGLLEDVAVDEGEVGVGDGGDGDDDGGGELAAGVEGVVPGSLVAVDEVLGPEGVGPSGPGGGVGDDDLDDAVLDDEEGVVSRGRQGLSGGEAVVVAGAGGVSAAAVLGEEVEGPGERGAVAGVGAVGPGDLVRGAGAAEGEVAVVGDEGGDPGGDEALGAVLGLEAEGLLDAVEDVREELEEVSRDGEEFAGGRGAGGGGGAGERARDGGLEELGLAEGLAGAEAVEAEGELAAAEGPRAVLLSLGLGAAGLSARADVAGAGPEGEGVGDEDVAVEEDVEARVDLARGEDDVAAAEGVGRVEGGQEVPEARGRDAGVAALGAAVVVQGPHHLADLARGEVLAEVARDPLDVRVRDEAVPVRVEDLHRGAARAEAGGPVAALEAERLVGVAEHDGEEQGLEAAPAAVELPQVVDRHPGRGEVDKVVVALLVREGERGVRVGRGQPRVRRDLGGRRPLGRLRRQEPSHQPARRARDAR